jgi:RNA polymerase sigma-70 factor, ECF subfamily
MLLMNDPKSFPSRVRFCAANLAERGEDAISGLIDLTSQRLVRFACTITRNQHDAEDAVQTVLIRIGNQPELLNQAENPWSYLLKMARNESLMIVRRRKQWFSIDNLCDLLTERRVDEVQREEVYREIWLALRQLPVIQSEVVVLKIWEEMTFAENADVLEVTPSTAASRYRYAIGKLSVMLRQTVGDLDHV